MTFLTQEGAIMSAKMARRPLLSIEEVSAYLGVPVATLYGWRTKGTGPKASRVGRWVRYRAEDIERWLDQQAQAPGASR